MKIATLKNKLRRLRNRLCDKCYGSEIISLETGNFITIKTTKHTGPISKKQIKAKVKIDGHFLNASVLEQERKLLNVLFEEEKQS